MASSTFVPQSPLAHAGQRGEDTRVPQLLQTLSPTPPALCHKAPATYKARGVVILDRLGVAKGLQDGVCLQKLLFQLPLKSIHSPVIGESNAGVGHSALHLCGLSCLLPSP